MGKWTEVANTIWAIWRCRNGKVYSAKSPTNELFKGFYAQITLESKIASTIRASVQITPTEMMHCQGVSEEYVCFVDGSWVSNWQSGIGYIIKKCETLIRYRMVQVDTCCPIQTEARALKEAVSDVIELGLKQCRMVQVDTCCPIQTAARALKEAVSDVIGLGLKQCEFLMDNQDLARLASALHPPIDADWRAHAECNDVWKLVRFRDDFKCHYIPRGQNELAGLLAKKGRVLGVDYTGYSYPIL